MIPNFLRGTALLALLLLSLLFQPTQLYAQSDPPDPGLKQAPDPALEPEPPAQPGLFDPSTTVGSLNRSDEPYIVQDRFVQLDANQVDITVTDLQLNFFDEADFSVEQTGIQQNPSGSLTWFGKVADDEDSQVILVAKNGIVVGNVESNGELYQVRYAGNNVHAVYKIDRTQFLPGAEPLLPDIDLTAVDPNDIGASTTVTDDGSILDVMVLYTPATKNAAGGTTAIEALIDLAIAETNTAYSNSDVVHRLNLVHQQEVAYDESNTSDPHLTRLKDKADGYMDSIHTLRDTYKADVVSLLLSTASFCGQGYVMTTPSSAFESFAFNVVLYSCATGNYSFGHEIGHNLGLTHDRANSNLSPAYPYGFGYQASDSSFRTIMAYDCTGGCTRIKHFSNPDVSYNGIPTGVDHDTDPNNSADNARAMDNVRVIAANWRVSGITGDCADITQIPQSECQALEAFYDSTGGDDWYTNTNWFSTNTPCSWYGLSCSTDSNGDSSVTTISMYYNYLTGTIPSEIGYLTNLDYLYLYYNNNLKGPIPSELGDLNNLTYLDLSYIPFGGTIPPELGNLSSLTSLTLQGNQFTGTIPSELGNLSNLTTLYLYNNQLTGVPAELSNLSNLSYLGLGSNQFTGTIPSELGNLSNLTSLDLGYNQLTSIPAELGNLSNLTGLYLYGNQLTSIPAELENLSNLSYLGLGSNQFTGTIPSELGNLSNLTGLDLGYNQLTSIPAELGNLSNLTSLYLYGNQLTSIPAELGNLSNLTSLYLGDNQLTGTIPSELGNLSNLSYLDLGYNQLTSIPAELGNLSNLYYLGLGDNQLTGTIPSELGNLSNLYYLYLYGNQLTSIPAELGNLSNLYYLYLGDNQLTGTIPSELGNLSNLSYLDLHSNPLSGSIPLNFTSLSSLWGFSFYDTQLCEPADTDFQDWLSNVSYVYGTDEICTSSGGAMIYINPISTTMAAGYTTTLQVMVDPSGADVNGAQVNAQLDPNYLEILGLQKNTSQLPTELSPASFDASTGKFSYSAGLINGTTISMPFGILDITVRALAPTTGTLVSFLSNFPPTDVSGPTGSVMGESRDGTVIIEDVPVQPILFGEIGLQGRPNGPDQSRVIPVAVELISTSITQTFTITLDQNGRFTQTVILSGTYDVRMVNSHTLASKAKNVVLNNGDNTVYLGPLMEGDTIQDNEIRVADFGLLSGAYNRCSTDAGFEDQTDLNEDNCTDLEDFGLLSGNYNIQGDIEYDVSSPPPLPIELATAQIGLRSENIADKAAGDVVDVFVFVDPNGSRVNGATAHLQFDPEAMEVLFVDLLAGQLLPIPLQEGQIDNELGTVQLSKGALGSTVSYRFNLARLSIRLKQQTDGASLAFSDDFPATNVTGTQGSVLDGTTAETIGGEVAGLDIITADLSNYGVYLPLITQ